MGDTHSKPGVAVQATLYGPAPFFCYPWKPLLNSVYGGGYQLSYKHFRAQHMDGTNLLLHCICLVWQLSANYAFLQELDQLFAPWLDKLLAPLRDALGLIDKENHSCFIMRTTSFLWSIHLLRTSPTPPLVKFGSVLAIACAHNILGDFFAKHWRKIVFCQGIIEAAGIQRLVLNRQNTVGTPGLVYFILRSALWKYVSAKEGCVSTRSKEIVGVTAALAAAAAASAAPLRVVLFGLVGWIIALLTGNKATYLWSAGMMATISQGIAHRVAGESGTLEVLQNDHLDQTSYELSHVTYFPNLLFQACNAHVKAMCS